MLSDEQRREYAVTLMLEHAREVEFLTIHEAAEDQAPGGVIDDVDALAVADLIAKADITITWH